MVKAAAGNWINGKEVMTFLLDKRGGDLVITEEVVKAAAGNRRNGKEVMTLLLDKRGSEVTVTEEVVKAAAGNEKHGHQILQLLIAHSREDTTAATTEMVLLAAATCGQDGVLDFISRQDGFISVNEYHRVHREILQCRESWRRALYWTTGAGRCDTGFKESARCNAFVDRRKARK